MDIAISWKINQLNYQMKSILPVPINKSDLLLSNFVVTIPEIVSHKSFKLQQLFITALILF